jgi:hypothetical protein
MGIESNCPGCGKTLRVAEEHAGKRARCPQCGAIYEVPSSSQPDPNESPQKAADTPTSAPYEQMKPEDQRWTLKTDDGKTFGPVSKPELDSWFQQGRVAAEDELQLDGDWRWRPAAELYPNLAAGAAAVSPVPARNPFAETDTDSANPFGPGGVYAAPHAARYLAPHRGGLILTFGILGWAVCIVFSVIAWAWGASDLREMRAGRMDESGRGLTTAGMILGMISTILAGVMFLLMMLFIGIGVMSEL